MLRHKSLASLGAFILLLLSAWVPSHYAHITGTSAILNNMLSSPINWDTDKMKWIKEFEQDLSEAYQRGDYPGLAVAVVKDNQVLICKGFGYRDQKNKELVDKHTVFRLASTSKGVAAALTGNLVFSKVVSWDDPVMDYIPEFRMQDVQHSQQILIKHILSHSAGFPYHTYTNLVEANVPITRIIEEMRDIKPIGDVGKIYSYQNAGYAMISEILERSTGEKFSDLIQQRLFDPLDMENASVSFDALMNSQNVAQPHMRSKSGWRSTRQQDIYYQAIPAGGINASISDMAQYIQALLGYYPDVLPPHILEALFSPMVSCPAKWKYFRGWDEISNLNYGLGFRIADFAGHRIAYHGGYIDGFRSEIVIDPNEKIGICILTNSTSSFPKKSLRKFLQGYHQVQLRS